MFPHPTLANVQSAAFFHAAHSPHTASAPATVPSSTPGVPLPTRTPQILPYPAATEPFSPAPASARSHHLYKCRPSRRVPPAPPSRPTPAPVAPPSLLPVHHPTQSHQTYLPLLSLRVARPERSRGSAPTKQSPTPIINNLK